MEKLKALERLEESLSKLPSVGKKSAERMAFAMLEMDEDDLNEFSEAIKELKSSIHICPICGNLTEETICDICRDEARDKTSLMVVSSPKDLLAFEKAESFHGLYHVLGGTISISRGKGIEDLNIPQLIKRIQEGVIKEVIIATNPTVDGETTALYLAKIIEPMGINVTRLAYGLPMGGNLDYADSLTLSKAFEGRRKI
ncbi:MAG: recombination protein RecR [Erysipelotrichaceae bacterium]|nr:recombination protein RecR [Erysipelotrichaceae bacterium]